MGRKQRKNITRKSVLKKAYKERKVKRIIGRVLWSLVLMILICGIVFTAGLLYRNTTFAEFFGLSHNTEESADGNESSEGPQNAEAEAVSEEETVAPEEEHIPEDQAVGWGEDMLHKGSLIVVNSEYPYDFAANEGYTELVTLNELQSFKHPLENDNMQVASSILSSLDIMMDDCDEAVGTHDTSVASAFRTVEYQQSLYDESVAQNGEEYTKQYVASPGCSEHHTGLAVDLGILSDGYAQSFTESTNAQWVMDNCYKYGFIRRYTEDKADITGVSSEAWHFRYVGVPHATYMHNYDLCLEEYLEVLKDYTQKNPLKISCATGDYLVFYTPKNIMWKTEYDYEVSGNNMDGYIVVQNITGEVI